MPVVHELGPVECERLLGGRTFGRVVLPTPRGAEVLPVNYVVDDGAVVVHTSPDGLLATHGESAELVFEVDEVDEEYWTGWSVVARGRATVRPLAPGAPRVLLQPWADGDRTCELRLRWSQLTGRRIGAAR